MKLRSKKQASLQSEEDIKFEQSRRHKQENASTGISTKTSSFNIFRCFSCCNPSEQQQPSDSLFQNINDHPFSIMKLDRKKGKGQDSPIYDPAPIEIAEPKVEYPIDQVFILGTKYKIVAKITVKKVSKETSLLRTSIFPKGMRTSVKVSRDSTCSLVGIEGNRGRSDSAIFDKDLSLQMKKEIFSKCEKGIKVEQWQEITPEKVAIHIADRLRCDVLIDALCGYGGNTIQFAKTCNFVIGIDIIGNKTNYARHNARVYHVDHKIDFLTGDFMKIQNITSDIVFLGPTCEKTNSEEPFSIFTDVQPEPLSLLAKSLGVSKKIAIQLPGDTQLEELPQLFSQTLEKHQLFSKRLCIEIERIVNSFNETECVIVYFGECSSITLLEEYKAIYNYISQNESEEWKISFPFHTVSNIIQKVGILRTFKYISEIEGSFLDRGQPVFSLFNSVLNKLVRDNILTKTEIERMIEDSENKPEWSPPESQPKLLLKKLSSSPEYSYSKANKEDNPIHSGSLLSKLIGHSFPSSKIASLHDKRDFSPLTDQEPIPAFKDSYELSDLPVSSYSVSSDYLMDFSEDEGQSRRITETGRSRLDSGRAKDRVSVKFATSSKDKKQLEENQIEWRMETKETLAQGSFDHGRKGQLFFLEGEEEL